VAIVSRNGDEVATAYLMYDDGPCFGASNLQFYTMMRALEPKIVEEVIPD